MLNYESITNMWGTDFEEREALKSAYILEELKSRQDYLKKKDAAIAEMQYERKLAFHDMLSVIRQDIASSPLNIFYGFNSEFLHKAWRYSCLKKEGIKKAIEKGDLTKEKAKEYKVAYEYAVDKIKDTFFLPEIKEQLVLKEIIMEWTSGYCFYFNYKDQEITLSVPTFSTVDEKNYTSILSGYIARYQSSPHCYDFICANLHAQEVKEKLHTWIISEGWKKKQENII